MPTFLNLTELNKQIQPPVAGFLFQDGRLELLMSTVVSSPQTAVFTAGGAGARQRGVGAERAILQPQPDRIRRCRILDR